MNNTAQEENLSRSGKIKKRLTEIWGLSEPYRLGFGLGALAVSATLIMVLTGQKSEKLNYTAKPANSQSFQEVVSASKEAGTSGSPVLGVQDADASPSTTAKVSSPAPMSVPTGKVNINTASAARLDTLPQVGPVTAKAIIDYRTAHGPFKSINDLDNVKGIGPKTIEKLRNFVVVE